MLYCCFVDFTKAGVVLLSHKLDDVQHLFNVLDTFCDIRWLIVNIDKTKMMGIKAIQPRHYPTFTNKDNQYK